MKQKLFDTSNQIKREIPLEVPDTKENALFENLFYFLSFHYFRHFSRSSFVLDYFIFQP